MTEHKRRPHSDSDTAPFAGTIRYSCWLYNIVAFRGRRMRDDAGV